MKLAAPERGSIIHYAYLWTHERDRAQHEGLKDRPALVLALSVREQDGETRVLVLAITHRRPAHPNDGVELPGAVKKQLGLDSDASWIVTTEANAFLWPGPDIRPVPERKPATFIYGRIPEKLLSKVAQSFLANRERLRAKMVIRND